MPRRYEPTDRRARPGPAAPRRLLLAVCLLLLGRGTLLAHNQSQGHSRMELKGATLVARVWLVAADYHALVALDANDDGALTTAEIQSGLPALATFSTQMLRVSALTEQGESVRCSPAFRGLDPGGAVGMPLRYPFDLEFACPVVPHSLNIRFGLFAGSVVRHTNITTVVFPEHTEEVVFSTEQREVTLRVASPSLLEVAGRFWRLGVEHILTGYDHLVFVLALLLAARAFSAVLWVVTAFTAAHSVSLVLAAMGVVSAPAAVVEPAIAASIMMVALQDLWRRWRRKESGRPRVLVALSCGLIHGLGFASALREAGLPQNRLLGALVAFNLGVESGQVVFCAVVWLALAAVRRTRAWRPLSLGLGAACALLGLGWLLQRVLG